VHTAGVGHLAMASDPVAVTDTLLDLDRALRGPGSSTSLPVLVACEREQR
jgi:hypothetical protein